MNVSSQVPCPKPINITRTTYRDRVGGGRRGAGRYSLIWATGMCSSNGYAFGVVLVTNKVRVWKAGRTPLPNFTGSTPSPGGHRAGLIHVMLLIDKECFSFEFTVVTDVWCTHHLRNIRSIFGSVFFDFFV